MTETQQTPRPALGTENPTVRRKTTESQAETVQVLAGLAGVRPERLERMRRAARGSDTPPAWRNNPSG